jgi:cell division protein FtsB
MIPSPAAENVSTRVAVMEERCATLRRDLQELEDRTKAAEEKIQELEDKKNVMLGWIGAAVLLLNVIPSVLRVIGWIK